MLNSRKRKILKGIAITSAIIGTSTVMPTKWVKPVVNSVLLPLHAQTTSVCSEADIIGVWIFEITPDGPGSPFSQSITFAANGTGTTSDQSVNSIAWSIENDIVSVLLGLINGMTVEIQMNISSTCDSATGSFINRDSGGTPVVSGTLLATEV